MLCFVLLLLFDVSLYRGCYHSKIWQEDVYILGRCFIYNDHLRQWPCEVSVGNDIKRKCMFEYFHQTVGHKGQSILIGDVIRMHKIRKNNRLSIFLLHPLHPYWNILAICETDKEPINPTGFPAPFAPMIICCCICTGIYSLCLYVFVVYYNMFDGKQ